MIPASVRIFVCTIPQDMRRSFDGLCLAAKELLGEDPQNGALYVFIGKRPTRVKILWWDRNGYCLLYKRFHRAIARLPAPGTGLSIQIDAEALGQLLAGIKCEDNWRNLH
jgi:transposase